MRPVLQGVLAGVVGGFAMNLFARAVSDRRGHGVQVPQALDGPGGVDAAERSGEAIASAVGHQPTIESRRQLGTAAHYAFSGFLGLTYAVAFERARRVPPGSGVLFGTGVWLLADEGVIPALGLSRGPRRIGARVHAFAWLGHCVYGAAVEATLRALKAGSRGILAGVCAAPPHGSLPGSSSA
jgi:hypothetical protein